MKPSCFSRPEPVRMGVRVLASLTLGTLLLPQPSPASGVVTNCTDADLRAALDGGGLVTFGCDGTIVLTNTITIASSSSLDASGRSVSLSGSNTVRLFIIQPGVTLTLRNLTLADGSAKGTNGADGLPAGLSGTDGQPGGPGEGGAVFNNVGTLSAISCAFQRNKAVGGVGGRGSVNGTSVGAGGAGAGGAIFSVGGDNFLTNVVFEANYALGGDGGIDNGFTVLPAGSGPASGGAIHLAGGTLAVHKCSFTNNGAAFGYPGIGDHRNGRTTGVAGGAVCSMDGNVTIAASSLVGNACGLGVGSILTSVGGSASGGAIYHEGNRLALTDTLLLNNGATGGPTAQISLAAVLGGAAFGGALFLNGAGAMTNCTLAGNVAEGGPSGPSLLGPTVGSGSGGAIYNQSNLTILNTTLSGNAARGGAQPVSMGGNGMGGGLYTSGGDVTLRHVTLAGNLALRSDSRRSAPPSASLGGGLFSTNSTVTLLNSIIANSPSGGNGFGTFVDGGHNISSDASFHFSAPGSLNNTDPVLGPLTDYGGPTPTMALLAGSPALDAADSANCPATDQRGIARPFGAGCDIGAFESAPPYTILGHVHGFTTPASGIQLTSPSGTTNVPPGGQFAVHGLATGTHLLSISSPECVFVPRTLSLTVGPDIVDAGFFSYRTNALFIERLSPGNVRWAYAGEAGATYHVLSGTNVTALSPTSTNQAQANGLIEFTEGPGVSMRFLQVVRP